MEADTIMNMVKYILHYFNFVIVVITPNNENNTWDVVHNTTRAYFF